jgi:hypothetical protein
MVTTTRANPQQMGQAAASQQQIVAQNRLFLRGSLERIAYAPVTGGSGTSATYSPGQVLFFDLPVVGSAFAKAILISYSLTVTPASSSNAAYNLNAAAPWSIFSELKLDYGNTQIRTHPYFLKVLDQLKGFQHGAQNRVLAGNNDANLAANIVGSQPLVVGSGNTWKGKMFVRLNALGEDSVPGVLPIMGVGNKPQLKLTCAPSFMGNDPLLNPVQGVNNSGTASVTVTGTVNVDIIYLDGTNTMSPQPLVLNLANEPTLQYVWDAPLTPFSSGSIQRQRFITLLEHWVVVSLIIDGNSSAQFMSSTGGDTNPYDNLVGFELSPDGTGQNLFRNWNISNNISIYDYYDREIRRKIGQDLDPGVIVWVNAPMAGISNPDNRNGHQPLNMQPNGGYTASTHAYQVNNVTTSTSGLTPRVETFLLSMNYDGLRIQ